MAGDYGSLKGAGIGIRFVALFIDGLVFLPISYIIAAFSGSASHHGFVLEGPGFLLSTLLGFAYYVFFEAKMGATPGKMVMGLRVVKVDGSPCDMPAAAIRSLLRVVDALPFAYLIGVISVWMSELNQRVGDRAAGTLVVKAKDLK